MAEVEGPYHLSGLFMAVAILDRTFPPHMIDTLHLYLTSEVGTSYTRDHGLRTQFITSIFNFQQPRSLSLVYPSYYDVGSILRSIDTQHLSFLDPNFEESTLGGHDQV